MARATAGQTLPGGLIIPTTGVFFGADDQLGFSAAGGIETSGMLNRRMAIRRRHVFWASPSQGKVTNNLPISACIADAALRSPRVIPCITWGSQGSSFPVKSSLAQSTNTATVNGHQGMDRITAGEFDTDLTAIAQSVASIPGPVIFNPWQEMNIPAMNCYGGYQGGIGGAGQSTYKAAVAHLRAVFDAAGATNVIWVWCPTLFDPDGVSTTYYPGNSVIHVVWCDDYRDSFGTRVDPIYNFAKTKGKPFGIGESGFQQQCLVNCADGVKRSKDGTIAGSAGSLIDELFATPLTSTYEETVFVVLWHFNPSGNAGSCSGPYNNFINTSATSLSKYQAGAASVGFSQVFGGTSGAPSNTSLPTISDTAPVVGELITTGGGTWSGTTPITLTYQWQVSATGTGSWSSATGSGATTSGYTVASVDLAQFLRVKVSATNSVGGPVVANSAATSAVTAAGAVPVLVTAPVLTGASVPPQVGDVLTTDHGSWSNTPTSYAETWQRKSSTGTVSTISGATSLTYTLATVDIGSQVRSSVIATNGTGSSAPGKSAWSDIVTQTGAAPSFASAPVIVGASPPVQGSQLVASAPGLSGVPAPTEQWQWQEAQPLN